MQVVQSVGNRTLNGIDESYIVAGDFLKEFECDSSKLDCLKKFSESLKIVEWALHQTKGIFFRMLLFSHSDQTPDTCDFVMGSHKLPSQTSIV